MIYRQTPLYKFIHLCEKHNQEKCVLDCGAGGVCPPLGLFAKHGYQTAGIEFDEIQLNRVREFETQYGLQLNISLGDMRKIPFPDATFAQVYSYNSIFHLAKIDIRRAIFEMMRVMKPDGFLFLNLLSIEDSECGEGECVGDNEYEQEENGERTIHSFHNTSEADPYFAGLEILQKETRTIYTTIKGKEIRQSYIDYYLKKS